MKVCDSLQNSLDRLVERNVITDTRKILNRDQFDKYNKAWTDTAVTKYGLDTEGQLLFKETVVEKTDPRAPYYRTDKPKIYFAEPNTVLFEKLDVLVNNYDSRSNTNVINIKSDQLQVTEIQQLFESNTELANAVYEALEIEVNNFKPIPNNEELDAIVKKRQLLDSNNASTELYNVLRKLIPSDIKIKVSYGRSGSWNSRTKELVLGVTGEGQTKNHTLKTLNHELLHSLTDLYLTKYEIDNKIGINTLPDGAFKITKNINLTNNQNKQIEDLITIYNHIVENVDFSNYEYLDKLKRFGKVDYFKQGVEKDLLGVHELISESFTNPELINILKNEKGIFNKKTTLFKEFLNKILRLFNINDASLLEDIYSSVENLIENNKTSQITPQQKQQAQQLYSQYLDTIFPDSKVKDIVYHGGTITKDEKFNSSKNGIHFSTSIDRVKDSIEDEGSPRFKNLILAILDIRNASINAFEIHSDSFEKDIRKKKKLFPRDNKRIETDRLQEQYQKAGKERQEARKLAIEQVNKKIEDNYYEEGQSPYDALIGLEKYIYREDYILKPTQIGEYNIESAGDINIAVKNPEQVHILGSKQDIEGFKEFVGKLQGDSTASFMREGVIEDIFPTVKVNVKLINDLYAKEVAENLVKRLSKNVNTPYEFITAEQAKDLLKNTYIPYKGEPAFFFAGTVYFVGENVNINTALHEFAHPFVRTLRLENPELFNKLYSFLLSTPEGTMLKERVQNIYPELSPEQELFQEEVFTYAVQNKAYNKLTGNPESKEYKTWFQRFLHHLKKIISKIFNTKKDLKDLSIDTTLDDLANLYLKNEINIDKVKVTDNDIAAFARFVNERAAQLTKSLNTEEATKIVNEIFARNSELLAMASDFKKNSKIRKIVEESLFRAKTTELLPGVKRSLSPYQTLTGNETKDELIESSINAEERRLRDLTNKAVAIVNSLDFINMSTLEMKRVTDKLVKKKSIDSRSTIALLTLYKNQIIGWRNTINNIDDLVSENNAMNTSNIFYKTLSEINANILQIEKNISKVYETNARHFMVEITGAMDQYAKDTLKSDLLSVFAKKLTDQEVEKIYNDIIHQKLSEEELLKLAEEKGGSKTLVKEYYDRYQKYKIDAEKINNSLSGKTRDVSWFNRFLEAYSSSTSIVVGSVSMFINDQNTEIENEMLDFLREYKPKLEKLLNNVNYSKLDTQKLRDMLTVVDKVFSLDKDGNPVAFELYSFMSEFANGWRFEEDNLKYNLQKAKESGNKDEIRKAVAALKQFQDDYMYREYVPEFYSKDDIFQQSDIAREAWLDRQLALDEFNNESNKYTDELEILENYSSIEAKWRDYQQLYSLNYPDGTPKVDDPAKGIYDLSKAKILIEHRKETRKFYEFVPLEGSLQTSYNNFISLLKSQGLKRTDPEWTEKLNEWKNINLRMSYEQEYYDNKNRLFTRLNELSAKVKDQYDFDTSEAYQKINNLIIGFRDNYGQPNAEELGTDRLQDIKDIQQKIIDFRQEFNIQSGLTTVELDRLNELITKSKTADLSDTEEAEFIKLTEKQRTQGLSPDEVVEFNAILSELSSMTNKMPTQYYMEALNYNLSKVNIREIASNEVSKFLESEDLEEILEQDENFKNWFEVNHVQIYSYDKKTKKYKKKYAPSAGNTYSIPSDPKMIKKTTILDTETNKEIVLYGVPSSRHSIQRVKNEYRTIKYGMKQEEYIGKYQDNKGNFLPRPYVPGNPNSAKDDRFINKDYAALKAQGGPVFELLEFMKQMHLALQKGKNVYSRLYLDIPRYAVNDVLESIQSGKTLDRFNQIKSSVKEKWDQAWGRSVADFENGFNYDPKNNLVNTDLDGNRVSYIPVTGIYRLEKEKVTADIVESIFKYGLSLTAHAKLSESLGLMNSLLDVLGDPKNQPKDLEKFQKEAFNTRNQLINANKKDSTNNTLGQLKSLIEREYLGRQVVGIEEYAPTLSKWLNNLQKFSARASLAVNLPSDWKNRYGQIVQNLIEASGGEFYNLKDYANARAWAAKTMMNWAAKDIYAMGNESLEGQLIQSLDAVFKTKDEFGRSVSRSIWKDLLNGEWMYMHRKFGEMEAALQLVGAFLYGQKVDQVLSDGTVKSIRFIDAWELNQDNKMVLKPGIDPAWNNTVVKHVYTKGETLDSIAKQYGVTREELESRNDIKTEFQLEDGEEIIIARSEKFKLLKNKIQGVSRRLYGAYDKFGQPEGNKYLGYRMFFFMRKWFTPMFTNRVAFDTNPENRFGYRYDWSTMTYTRGYYITAFKALYSVLRNRDVKYSMLSKQDKAAVNKFIAEGMFTLFFALLISMIFGFDDDDPDKWKKIEERSGPMFTDNFNTWGFMVNHMLLLVMGVQAETTAFIPLPEIAGVSFGLDEYNRMLTSTTSAFYNTVILYTQIFGDVLNVLMFNDDAVRYKRDIGPYWWQQEGELKLWKRVFKTVGFTGGTGDAESLIKSLEQQGSKLGG